MTEVRTELVSAAPRPPLRSLVAGYHGYRARSAAGTHRGLPSRHLTFVVTIEGTVDLVGPMGSVRSFDRIVGGLRDVPVSIAHDGHQYGIQADLTPLGARILFGLPAGALAGTDVDLETLLGRRTGEFVDRVRTATTWGQRFAHLDTAFERLAASAPESAPAPEVGWVWQRLAESAGGLEVAALAAEVGWSRQHLRTSFRAEYGLTPKVAARLMRFEAARRLVAGPERMSLAQVAVRCGYADQAHLHRDWTAFAGCTPTTWIAEELPFVQDGSGGAVES
ncbi:helix-turn-helix domain-containing protein [Actinopolymorpha pittospori]